MSGMSYVRYVSMFDFKLNRVIDFTEPELVLQIIQKTLGLRIHFNSDFLYGFIKR